MNRKLLGILGLITLAIALLLGSMKASWAMQQISDLATHTSLPAVLAQRSSRYPTGIPVVGCMEQPQLYPPQPNIETAFVPGVPTLNRFRHTNLQARGIAATPENLSSRQRDPLLNYQPREEIALAHATNFGERYHRDINGQPVSNWPIIVLHETVSSGWQAVRFFQTPHPRDDDQASYHALIKLDGTIFYLVPPDKRAFGAGNSTFGGEAVKTNRLYPSSVNNFAYHISFETPPNGRNNARTHGGYTDRQYLSAAWLVAKTGVPESRITTHQAVDRSGTRIDPRSFDGSKFQQLLARFPKSQEIPIGCPVASASGSTREEIN